MSNIVRALDIGYGGCKFTTQVCEAPFDVKLSSFPSMAVVDEASRVSSSFEARSNVVTVEVDDVRFLVGPDVRHFVRTGFSPVLDPEYASSKSYRALFLAGLYYMNTSAIDLLVVGLPLSTFESKRHFVSRTFKGEHRIGGRTIVVRDVLVVPQPVGGLYSALHAEDHLQRGLSEINVIIDPGFFTTDFLTAKGTKLLRNRSGVHVGGISSVLQYIASRVDEDYDTHTTDISRLDAALMRRAPLTLRGEHIPLDKYLGGARAIIEQTVNHIASRLGPSEDAHRIVLVGGGSPLLEKPIRARYARHRITVEKDPVYSNVRGFALIGLGKALSSEKEKANAAD